VCHHVSNVLWHTQTIQRYYKDENFLCQQELRGKPAESYNCVLSSTAEVGTQKYVTLNSDGTISGWKRLVHRRKQRPSETERSWTDQLAAQSAATTFPTQWNYNGTCIICFCRTTVTEEPEVSTLLTRQHATEHDYKKAPSLADS